MTNHACGSRLVFDSSLKFCHQPRTCVV